MSVMNPLAVRSYVKVSNLDGAYYFAWVTANEAEILVKDLYTIEPAKRAPRQSSPRRPVTLANTDDHIADICFMLANSALPPADDEGRNDNPADYYANGMRIALETLVESLGQRLLEPPTKATQAVLDMWTRRMVQKFHTWAVVYAKQKAGQI
jgi:hypothetical protein